MLAVLTQSGKNGLRRTITDEAILDALFISPALSDRQDVRLKPKFETACWSYLPPHRIYIGLDLFEKDSVRPGLSDAQKSKYIANHYNHERAHGLFTGERPDVNAWFSEVNHWCASRKIPFSLWNLFEDVFIEAKYREATGYRFEWTDMEFTNFNRRPEGVLFALIQHEGAYDELEKFAGTWAPKPGTPDGPLAVDAHSGVTVETTYEAVQNWLPRVKPYFERATKATVSMDLKPLIEAWVDEFGLPPQPKRGEDLGDLALGMQLQQDADALAQFDKDAKPLKADKKNEEVPEPAASDDKLIAAKGEVLFSDEVEAFLDGPRARALATVLKALFERQKQTVHTHRPSRKISAKRFALGLPAFRKPLLSGKAKQSVMVVFDMSGSMRGFHAAEGRVFLSALSELARLGLIEGHVVFSAVVGGRPQYETYALPLSDRLLGRVVPCHGAEGLDAAIRTNMTLVKESDHVFVYTDAKISDHEIDKAALHRQGVFTFGLYVGNDAAAHPRLLKYFDKGVARNTVEDLVAAVLTEYR